MRLSDRVYDILKWICLVAIPALAVFLGVLLPSVGVGPDTVSVIITIVSAVGAFIGTLIGVSTAQYTAEMHNGNDKD